MVGSWRLVAAGGWRRLVAGGWWRLVVGGWWRLAVDGSWRLAVGGPLGLSLRAVLSKEKKFSSLNDTPDAKRSLRNSVVVLRITETGGSGRVLFAGPGAGGAGASAGGWG